MEINVHPAWQRDDVNEAKQQAAIRKIDKLLTDAAKAFDDAKAEAERIADELDINIYLAPTGYGSGSTYMPAGSPDWDSSGCTIEGQESDKLVTGQWVSSSQNC